MKEGRFLGRANGYGGSIELEVVVTKGQIAEIEVIKHFETKMISDPAFAYVIPAIIEAGSVCVPNVNGCSVTSMALKRAVADALVKSGVSAEELENQVIESETLEKIAGTRRVKLKDEYDVSVIGSGGAGLSAAIGSASKGARVLVLEKRTTYGGNTLVSMGGVNIPGNDAQLATGVEDSKELYCEDIMVGGDNESIRAQVEILAEHALETYEWLKDEVGVQFKDKALIHFGGHTVARAAVFKGKYAIELITKLRRRAEELGCTIANGIKVEVLLQEGERVSGIQSGAQVIKAKNGVILATGGFSGNVKMRMEYDPSLDERYKTTNVSGIEGDGHEMAREVGAKFVHMHHIQTFPIANPRTGELSHVGGSRFDGAILVNKEGKRFVEELGRRDEVSEGILSQSGGVAYLLWGQEVECVNNGVDKNSSEVGRMQVGGFFVQGDTIEELARKMGIDEQSLVATVASYNEYVRTGVDKDYQRRGKLVAIDQAPFYIQTVAPAVHHTMGGVSINERCQVLREDGTVISGLYAAGEIVGGTHGTNRLGGNAITEILVFGKRAGEECRQNSTYDV